MTISIAIVCEAPADRRTIATLAERVIREAAPWIEPEAVGDYLTWRGFRATDPCVRWAGELDQLADELGILVRFRGVHPLHPYSQNALRAIRVLSRSPDPVDAIILVPDSDCDLDRLKGLAQARDYTRAPFPVVIGLAHAKRECWHINGFEPEADHEQTAINELRSELGFDFRRNSEELTAKHDPANDKRSAKRVLSRLTGGDADREHRCLTHLPLTELKDRGRLSGLADFLEEIERHLVPLFVPHAPMG